MSVILEAVGILLQPQNLLYVVIGFLVGTFGGIIPGVGGALTLSLLIPFTLSMGPESAVILLAGAYTGTCTVAAYPPYS